LSAETLICLVRHGVTDWNYEGRAQGRTDVPLNREGIQQAEAVAERLAREEWHAIYSSPLKRAFSTAEAIARRIGLPVQPEPGLMERNLTVAEGSTELDRRIRWPGKQLREIPGVETDAEMAVRAHRTLEAIARRHPGERVICVSHGGLMKVFLESVLARDGEHPRLGTPGNTAVASVGFNGERFRVIALPDTSHLLVNGIEFSGESWRARRNLKELAALSGLSPEMWDTIILRSSAVECAWQGDRLVAFARMFTDGVVAGYVDLVLAEPGYTHLIPVLLKRLQDRFPDVTVTRLPEPPLGPSRLRRSLP